MEDLKRPQIPKFGNWDCYEELPITQYFDSAMQAGFIHGHYFGEDGDLFKVPVPVVKPSQIHHHRKARKGGREREYSTRKEQQRKQERPREPKAVDEDLYKIPPELLYQKPKRKRLLRDLWAGCLGINCVA
ncbi:uncharacterized protein [Typha latifolia]|uniref:uncharacterized protein n=1 Tax=Typha latifolia TaxID=4733 RepID=UPI003C2F30C7